MTIQGKAKHVSGIYAIRKNERMYVGSSADISKRWYQHRVLLRKGTHHSPHLQNAWTKHGEEAFEFLILEECPVDRLLEREQYHLDRCSDKYNCAPIAGSRLEVPFTDEQKARLSEQRMGHGVSPETREKIRQSAMGNKRSAGHIITDEHRAILSASMMGNTNGAGRIVSPETREKIAAAQRGVPRPSSQKPKSEETRRRMSTAAKARAERQRLAKMEASNA